MYNVGRQGALPGGKQMKKMIKAALCALMMFVLAACAGAGSAGSIEKSVFLLNETEAYKEYLVVYYNSANKALTGMTDEVHVSKDQGYTADQFNETDFTVVYPGFDTYSFTSFDTDETDDHIALILQFRDLDNKENAKAAADMGLIQLFETGKEWNFVEVTGILRDMKEKMTEVDASEAETLGLHFQ